MLLWFVVSLLKTTLRIAQKRQDAGSGYYLDALEDVIHHCIFLTFEETYYWQPLHLLQQ